jgi:hypothetical protein
MIQALASGRRDLPKDLGLKPRRVGLGDDSDSETARAAAAGVRVK